MVKRPSTSKRKGRRKRGGAPPRDRTNWKTVPDRVRTVAEPLCLAEGIEFVHVECPPGPRGRTLRIYLDKPGGILLDDCVAMSRLISDLLDVELDIQGQYRLEVSSPGPERPLSKPADFERFAGEQAKIVTREPLDNRKTITGILKGWSEGNIRLLVDGQEIEIPYDGILGARLAPQ